MYHVVLKETTNKKWYWISASRVRLWEDITETSPHMHFYDMGFKPTAVKE